MKKACDFLQEFTMDLAMQLHNIIFETNSKIISDQLSSCNRGNSKFHVLLKRCSRYLSTI